MSPRTLERSAALAERQLTAHRRHPISVGGDHLCARLTDDRERGRASGDPHHLLLEDGPGGHYAAARSANFAYRFRKESFSIPVGPLRCLERMISASPCWSLSSL